MGQAEPILVTRVLTYGVMELTARASWWQLIGIWVKLIFALWDILGSAYQMTVAFPSLCDNQKTN